VKLSDYSPYSTAKVQSARSFTSNSTILLRHIALVPAELYVHILILWYSLGSRDQVPHPYSSPNYKICIRSRTCNFPSWILNPLQKVTMTINPNYYGNLPYDIIITTTALNITFAPHCSLLWVRAIGNCLFPSRISEQLANNK
jgi:hypothetical protein